MKENQYVLVEMINDSNDWAYYGIYADCTPEEAIQHVAREHGEETGEIKADSYDGYFYAEDADFRAMVIEIESLKKQP